eukprot:Plantae.Rhodophyta-Purpureofilum_apyrenoidigerum.ctg6715.p1 GENE.Plantae.Rhodophyta-Purpureofilum_apyrenoidigerum.ctg6715~~Plantae.Rhodophyta-Purpureofilum_apyrenoidigerum.ctg6715.p1  ORF type:complete len:368 (+),score=35.41 Plantae.Rhodophyta-Purpureofilum_apyrenoidigerum.ctg6715:147-1250(+)
MDKSPCFCGPAIGVGSPRSAIGVGSPRPTFSLAKPRLAGRRAGLLTVRCAIVRPERYSSQDWQRNLWNFPKSVVLQRIRSHLFFNFVGAVAVYSLHRYNPDMKLFHLSVLPHQLMGTAASLLLVFRTNAAYDRFWEGRKLWGTIVNRSRDLASCADVYLKGSKSRERILLQTATFCFVLQQHLEGYKNPSELPFKLSESENAKLNSEGNRPFRICQMMRQEIEQAFSEKGLNDSIALRMRMEEDVTTLIDVLGACERIIKTPVPLSYSRHTSRFLSIYAFTLPFILVEQDNAWMALSILVVTWALFAIEEIGHVIEDPFSGQVGSLPLKSICSTILGDMKVMMGSETVAKNSMAQAQPAEKAMSAGR